MRQSFTKIGNQFTRSWKRFLGLNGYRPTSQRPRPRPSLRVEQLEDRLTPADINIDTFNQANLVNPIEILTGVPPAVMPTVTTSATDVAANILGTHREVSLVKTTGAQDDSASVNVAAGRASLNLGVNVGGNVLFIWDGTPGGDTVGTVTTNGLGGFDLATETNRFELRLRGDPTAASGAGTPFRITVYTEDVPGSGVYVAHSQTRNLTVPNDFVVLAYDYSSFGGANFSRVGAITLETLDPPLGADIDFDLLLARQVADLSLTKTKVTPTTTPAVGDLVTFRLTITNAGPNVADNVTVSDPAVTGLEYVSDNGAGAFNSTTRVWTVGHLDASGAGATKTLDITYRVSGTVAINNYAQITFSSAFDPDSTPGDGSGSGGGNPGHQDDDSTFTFTPLQVDFGDAPNSSQSGFTGSYPTTLADNGARHVATGVRLGSGAPDTEQDGQPNATATGDDAAGTDDENGVTLPAAGFGTGATTPITVNVTNASAGAFLNVWFDFNRDGDWDDAGEHVVSNAAVVNGNNTIDIAVPVTASEGTSFARFRITDAEGSGSSTGLEPTGEVEDYQVTIVKAIDLSLTKGVTDTTPDLGDLVDFTLTVSNAAGLNDAPGVVVRDVLPTGLAFVQVVSSTQGTLTGNDWSVGTVATGASHTLVIRARVTGSGTIVNFAQVQSTTGPADRDSVPGNGTSPTPNEDDEAAVTLTVPFVDFGDAPASYGTMLADGGARHNLIPNVAGAAPRLGTAVDAETDGPAAGTGVEDGADEDGVSFALPGNTLLVNENNEITITGTVGALVDAWIDFDGNGAFDPTTERITAVGGSAIGAGGTLTLTVNPAVGVTLGDTYARFRVSSAGGLNPTGLASDGEVEDYAIRLANRADLSLTKTLDSTGPFNLGDVVQFTLTVTNAGSSPATGVTVSDLLPSGLEFVAQVAGGTGTYDGTTWDLSAAPIATSASVSVSFTARIVASGLITNLAEIATANEFDPNSTPGNNSTDEDDDDSADLTVQEADFGDAPDTYGTTLANGGAFHVAIGPMLGATRDTENTGAPSAAADGDGADEDGFTAPNTAIVAGGYFIQGVSDSENRITLVASGAGFVNAWIDFNQNGTFDDAERILTNAAVVAGDNFFDIDVPSTATLGDTYARFRITSDEVAGTPSPTGRQDSGEVEDYQVNIRQVADLELSKSVDNATPNLGSQIVYTLTVTNTGPNDATGVVVTDVLPAGVSYVSDDSGGAYNSGTGVWTVGAVAVGTPISLQITVRVDASGTIDNYAQITDSDQFDDDSTPDDDSTDEDDDDTRSITVAAVDFGDAPDTYGTTLSADGARHIATGVFLGTNPGTDRDTENNGAPSAAADGDGADEGGFTAPNTAIVAGGYFIQGVSDSQNRITLVASGAGFVNAWIDFDGNGVFDAGEQVLTNAAVDAGSNTFDIDVPADAALGDTYARFRITDDIVATPSPTGLESSGEVEDYRVNIRQVADLEVDKTVDNASPLVGDQVVFTITVTNQGPNDATGVTVLDALPGGLTYVSDNGGGAYDSGTGVWDVGTLASGASVSLQITARVTAETAQTNAARVETSDQFDPDSTPANDLDEDDRDTVTVTPTAADFGDAPTAAQSGFAGSYPTTVADNGARHGAVGLTLGATRDTETNGQPNGTATGDGADEDGVALIGTTTIGTTQTIVVSVGNASGSNVGFLNAWIDFNRDGDWNDAGEQVLVNRAVNAGFNVFVIAIPLDAAPGDTYARFRLASAPVATPVPTGSLPDGEVEDYQVTLQRLMDFGDAPDTYGTTAGANGAAHVALGTGPTLGNAPDVEADGQPSPNADGDGADEDGVSIPTLLQGTSATITVNAPQGGRLDAFIDFNGDGDFDDAGERITAVGGTLLSVGTNSIVVNVPAVDLPGPTSFARFRISSAGNLGPTGFAPDGEVEDYQVTIQQRLDFGDAPDSYGTTGATGARHTIGAGTFFLGAGVDAETDGQPNAAANGDDANGSPDDEDGVTFVTVLGKGADTQLQVVASKAGKLDAWVDFDGNGIFDPGEQIFTNQALVAGVNLLSFAVPLSATTGDTYARFRLSSAGGLGATGAAADGEVEDYRVTILDAGSVSGTVYTDLDKDGVLDAGEPRLAGVVITLIDENGQPVANTVTGPDGTYLFTGVPVGQYSIVETQPNGYGSSTPNILTNIQVQQNVESKDNNFGEIGGSLAGKVYFDPNNSGVQDAGEPGIIGVTVQLTGVDVNGLAVNRTTSTNLDGSYRFDGLAAGTYTITETQPAHYSDGKESLGSQGGTVGNDVFSNIALGAAVDGVNYNFGEGGRIISGTVFLDTNAPTPNGKLDTGEVGIPQVTLSLRDSLGNILAFAQTAPDGSYLFNLTALGLPAGNYTVVEIQPAGYGSSDPSNNTRNVTVPTTGLTNVNFGDTLGSIGGFVYFDQNNNGVKAANEAGIPGVTLTLTGVTSTGKAVNLTTTTGADGSYRFDGLLASNAAGYTITETQPGTYTDGKDTRGTVNGVNVGTAGNDVMTGVVLGGGQQGINYNFGERLATSKTFVSGTVFVDADNDGQLDPGEIGLAGVTVELRTTQNVLVATQTTDANGNYVFAGIAAGKYNIVETQPAGYDSTTSNTLANVNVPTTGLGNQNFGENQGSLSGFAYLDANNDGIKNDNETPLAGVVITLSGGPTSRAPVVTAADGSYHFTGLQAGNYTITETQPANVGDGKDTAGSLGGDTTVNDAISVTLGIGQQGVNYNFGERPTGLNGRVFLDLDDDGIVDPGEVGIAGVVINLTGVDNGLKLSTVTDADGFYRFPELPPGTYTISEVQPATLLDGKDVDNTGATIGAGNGDADQFVNVTAEAGVLKGPFNFAERLQPGTGFITGTVYLDRDRNQVQGGTEPGQTGVLVELLQGNTVIATTTTNPDGSYNFFNVPPGDYTTRLANDDPPSGFGASTATTSATLTVPAGGSASADFGLTLGTVSGFVYRDNNLNGVRNTGEAGIANVVLNLTGTDVNGLAVIRSVQTDENGFYRFQDLVAGNYAVAETQAQPALINFYDGDGLAVPGNLTGVVDVDLSGTLSAGDTSVGTRTQNQLSNLVLTAGAAIIEDNFGEIPPADPSGFVYHDRNNNGFKDAGEEGIAGVQIRLSGTAFAGTVLEHALTAADFILNGVELDPNLDGDNDPLTVRTDTDGHWAFEVMPPGVFALEQVTQPPDFFDGLDRDDVDVLSPTNDRFENILLAAGELRQPFNFGERRGSLSGRVFVDNNNNGVQDATELGRAGVVITLTGQTRNAAGQVVAITRFATTDANGNYTFADLPPSEAAGYRLTMTTPSNMLRGRAFPGTRGGTAITVGAKNLAIDGVNMQPGIPDLDGITNNFSLLLAGKSRFIGR